MISKSVKAKRRQNQNAFKKIEAIQICQIDFHKTTGTRFYLLSLSINKNYWVLIDARGEEELFEAYNTLRNRILDSRP